MLGVKSSQLSFYGDHVYDWVIPEDHSLKLLNKAVTFPSSTSFAGRQIPQILVDLSMDQG